MDYSEILQRAKDYIAQEQDEGFCKEVQDLMAADNKAELEDRFYQNLELMKN